MYDSTKTKQSKSSAYKRKLIYGIGVNDANYTTSPRINGKQLQCKFYQVWWSMFHRCYSSAYHKKQPTYIGCSVDKEWHSFMAFKLWMKSQDWENKQLDKDIIIPGNRVYCKDACVFVSRQINSILNAHNSKRGKYPTGVVLHKRSGKFYSEINRFGNHYHLGCFATQKEASNAYKDAKQQHLLDVASKETNKLIKFGLIRHALLIANKED